MNTQPKVTIIKNQRESLGQYLQKIWTYRLLILNLAKRDLKIKYAQTALGILWSIFQPLTGLLIFTIFFDKLIQVDTLGIPYPLFAFSGMVSWYFFTYIIAAGGLSLTEAQDLLKKVYFPKIALPLAKVLVGLVEFAISFCLLLVMMLLLGHFPPWTIVLLPLLILLNIVIGLSVAIWLSALTIRYRDFHHIIPYLMNFGIWLTPVFYPSTLIPADFSYLLYINPMAAIIAGFRWAVLGDSIPSIYYLVSLIPVIVLFIAGLSYFRKVEVEIADII